MEKYTTTRFSSKFGNKTIATGVTLDNAVKAIEKDVKNISRIAWIDIQWETIYPEAAKYLDIGNVYQLLVNNNLVYRIDID